MKPGVYTQLYTHLVFAVKYRDRLITKDIRTPIFSYISGIISHRKHKSIIINGVEDHIHILFGLNPNDKISDLVASIKRSCSTFINEHKLITGKFHWQDGYGAFSYSKSHLDRIYKYIENQEQHHSELNFREEYLQILEQFNVKFDQKYLFEFFE